MKKKWLVLLFFVTLRSHFIAQSQIDLYEVYGDTLSIYATGSTPWHQINQLKADEFRVLQISGIGECDSLNWSKFTNLNCLSIYGPTVKSTLRIAVLFPKLKALYVWNHSKSKVDYSNLNTLKDLRYLSIADPDFSKTFAPARLDSLVFLGLGTSAVVRFFEENLDILIHNSINRVQIVDANPKDVQAFLGGYFKKHSCATLNLFLCGRTELKSDWQFSKCFMDRLPKVADSNRNQAKTLIVLLDCLNFKRNQKELLVLENTYDLSVVISRRMKNCDAINELSKAHFIVLEGAYFVCESLKHTKMSHRSWAEYRTTFFEN